MILPLVTLDGTPAPAGFALHILHCRLMDRSAFGCNPCGSVLYRDRPHRAGCRRMAAVRCSAAMAYLIGVAIGKG